MMGLAVTGARAAGPFGNISLGDASVALWVVEFGADGACLSPRTSEMLRDEVAEHGYTDVFLFAHGWNNTFDRAVAAYERFAVGYHGLQRSNGLRAPDPYRPLLVGVFWPSIDLILPGEKAPEIAAVPVPGTGEDPSLAAAVAEVTAALEPEGAARFGALAGRPDLPPDAAKEMAGLLAGAYPADDEVDPEGSAPSADDVMATWTSLTEAGLTERGTGPSGPDSFGVADEDQAAALGPDVDVDAGAAETAGPATAGGIFDPRDIVRAFTVYKMKDRAGVVGATGASELVNDLLAAGDFRLHLIGHSYGCRLLLSAICARDLSRKAWSLLLLEPAVNYLCFDRQVPKRGTPGGYRAALSRVEEPIMSTFSPNDRALHDFFHLAVRRGRDLGELKIAALGAVPSLYAALGGWGPGGLDDDEAEELPLTRCPERYAPKGQATRVLALNGATGITSHSDVINDWTFWALYNQVVTEK